MSYTALLETLSHQRTNDRIAIQLEDGSALTYRALCAGVDSAVGMLNELALQRGDVLAIQANRGIPLITTILGALQSGVTVLPLNVQYTASELRFFIKDASAKVVILQPQHLMELAHTAPVVLDATTLPRLLSVATPHKSPTPTPNTLAFIIYTSGTTGRPKGAMIRHGNLNATLLALHTAWGWRTSDRLLHVLPLTHIHGLFVALFGALYAGATVFLAKSFDAHKALTAIETHKITMFMGVPTHYHRLLGATTRPDLSTMRLFTSGSAPLPAKAHADFSDQFGHMILERYGMTEVGIVLSNSLTSKRIAGSVGKPLPGVTVRIVDKLGKIVPDGQVGQLQIRGASVIDGYLGLPDATAKAIVDGWMNSGDLATQAQGIYRIVGRATDMVISGGLNVYPREIETALLRLSEIAEAAVVGFPDSDFGERVVAFIVATPDTVLDSSAIFSHIKNNLAPHKRPKAVYRLKEFPRNTMGKVKKNELRALSHNPPLPL
jgi:malonyl-CoA/methylmalonyl-CoA synthetase